MPSYTRGKLREELKFVKINKDVEAYYGFNSKDFASITGVSDADITALGHLLPSAVPDAAVKILRASSPKPMRVKKRIKTNPTVAEQGSVSTFCGGANLSSALTAGWKLLSPAKATSVNNGSNGRSITALVEMSDGSFYAFPMNKADFDAAKAALGLQAISDLGTITATERWTIIAGSSYPKPGVASKSLEGGATESHFYSTDASDSAVAAGWNLDSEERLLEY